MEPFSTTNIMKQANQVSKCLLPAVLFLSVCVNLRAGNDAALTSVASELSKLRQLYRDHGDDSEILKPSVVRIDQSIQQLLVGSLNDLGGDFAKMRQSTRQTIRWIEWPTNCSAERIAALVQNEEPLCIYFRGYKTVAGRDLFCMANSLFAGTSRYRIHPSYYTLTFDSGRRAVVATLLNLPTNVTGFESAPVFLGFIDYGLPLPAIFILSGPHGSGAFARGYLFSSDKADSWASKKILEISRVTDYIYNESTHTLQYQVRMPPAAVGKSQLQTLSYVVPKTLQILTNDSGPFDK